ncbi:Methionine aminopeptidase [Alteracholeplasma palmae J233]|uniref:Methionine aminopeptidase n=1 Tax=Alteracholeplasma palmae (strain ATCC 49389 / J233) TaxID=1318466 RepID=U4KQN8_ALTPJ|nr:type I methionyl aminopeptidase [Alteracholeplasma palmae]CCV64905.1 Methionine aminopeptidase [Alteracholeplasma palmae J233]
MILIKSKREIELMKKAGEILDMTRKMLVPHIKPGVSTHQLDILAENFIKDQGATPSFKNYNGFPGSICASVNEVVVHGIPSKKKILKDGDIITVDLGVCYKGYHSDSAWTYPVGNISDEVKQLLEVTEKSLFIGLEQAKPGNHVSDISHAIEQFVKPYGYGIVEEFTGHGIGQSLHEDPYVPNFGAPKQGALLKPGMTFCVEPMLNLGTKRVRILSDNWTTVTSDKKYSAHYEHTIVITETGYEILSTIKE